MLRFEDQRGEPPKVTNPQDWVERCLTHERRSAVNGAANYEMGVPIVKQRAREIVRELALTMPKAKIERRHIYKVLKQPAPVGFGSTRDDPYLIASFTLYVGYILQYKFPSLSWRNIRFHTWKTFIQTATKSPEGLVRNHRFQIGLQFLAKEPEFAAFTKLQIDDKGDLADLPDYTTELYEAMTRVCAGEL